MKIEECIENVKNDIKYLKKLKNKIDCLVNEYDIVKINKKYIKLLEKKHNLLKSKQKNKLNESDIYKSDSSDTCQYKICKSDTSDVCKSDTSDTCKSDIFWDKCQIKNKSSQVLKIEKQLGTTLYYFKFEKSKCNIVENDSLGNPIGFGKDVYDQYKIYSPNQLYFYNLKIYIRIFSHTIKIINTSTAESLNGDYTLYYVDDELVDNRIFFENCPHFVYPILKLYKKLKKHKHVCCKYNIFLKAFISIVNTFQTLLGFKKTEHGFTEKICLCN